MSTTILSRPAAARRTVTKTSLALGALQIVLALLFAFAGSMKFVLPVEVLTKDTTLSALFFRCIGAIELLGAAGLLLPLVLRTDRVRRMLAVLAPLAALGLVAIMIGATSLTMAGHQPSQAVVPFVVGLLLLSLAYGRRAALLAHPLVRTAESTRYLHAAR